MSKIVTSIILSAIATIPVSAQELAESEEHLLEQRTDGSDAFDTLYIGCEKFPYHDTFSLSMSGVL